jgi:predicted transcriptional regulator
MKLLKKSRQANSELVQKFNALGDKTRFRLLELLMRDDGICVSELAQEIEISNAGVSQQLKIMEQAGIIVRERSGQKICYRIDEKSQSNRQLLSLIK